ncbi:cupin domain-containing protein [Flavobacterium cellulosilyticum]|uniref:Cupin domain-containing protein n=1 Tax=Flavobacterium cellulosilyticum TaxID=2541731 RepID=A0A4R5CBY3_9FLAO|nr:cupin domain-containing protein [Flavobacterium cellulosilyticum]TDD97468.1 cupin domain-containing protein [Flavobacterium cellulosilyticum]
MNKVIDKETAKHYFWGENCKSWILADSEGLSVKQENMPSGTKEKLHFHSKAQQFFYILKGTATFYLNDTIEIVKEQKGILVDAKTKHYIANETDDILDFLVISQPTTNNDRTII